MSGSATPQPQVATAPTQAGVRPSASLQAWESQSSEEFSGAEELERAVTEGEL